MSDKYTEITSEDGTRVERIPNKDSRVGHQYFVEDAVRDLHVSNPELGEGDGTGDGGEVDEGGGEGGGDTSGD